MDKPRASSDGGVDFILFFFNPTEKTSDAIIVANDKLFIYIYYGRKMSTNCSKLGSNCQLLINPVQSDFNFE